MNWQDLLTDDEGDLLVEDGDFVIGDSVDQEAIAILQTPKGNFKNDPLLGSELVRLKFTLGGEAKIKQAVRLALERDNKVAKGVTIDNDGAFHIEKITQQ